MPGRTYSAGAYRYGFQGQEKDDEIKGEGNSVNYKYRMHDPRIGRFLTLDPAKTKYPAISPYTAFVNNPNLFNDVNGDTVKIVTVYLDKNGKAIKKDTKIQIVDENKLGIHTKKEEV